jgi:hypothetical protein
MTAERIRMAQVSEWLKLMVAEINRKREDAEREREEEKKRQGEATAPSAPAKKRA